MDPTFRWVALAAATLGLLLSLFLALWPDDRDDGSVPRTTTAAATSTTRTIAPPPEGTVETSAVRRASSY